MRIKSLGKTRAVILLGLALTAACVKPPQRPKPQAKSHDALPDPVPKEESKDPPASLPVPSKAEPAPEPKPDTGVSDPGTEGDGSFENGPAFTEAPETKERADVKKGRLIELSLASQDSKIYRGDEKDRGLKDPKTFTRKLWLYIPSGHKAGDESPFIVVQDGGNYKDVMKTVLDNMIAAKKLPPMLAVFINPGPGDGKGSQRGLEYDTVSDAYVQFIETEVLPKLASEHQLKFTKNPEGRASMGGSSGGAAAFTMGWFRPDLYRRILTYSGTFVSQHPDATYKNGAWEYHARLIKDTEVKPLRVFLQVADGDNNFGEFHNWPVANRRMADALKAKGYHYRFIFSKGAGHVDSKVLKETLPQTLEWLWRGYPIP